MKKKWIFSMLLFGSLSAAWAQKNDTTIVKEGNREVRVIVKEGNDNRSKEVVVIKKYVIKDSADLAAVMKEEEDTQMVTDSAGRKKIIRKQVVIVDETEEGKIVRQIDINIPNMDSIEQIIEKELEIAQIEIEKGADKIERKTEIIQKEVEDWVEKQEETEIIVGNRKVFIGKDKDGEYKVIIKKKNKRGEWIEEKERGEKQERELIQEEEWEEDHRDGSCEGGRRSGRKPVDVDFFGLDLGWNNYFTEGRVAKTPVEMMGLDNLRSMHVTTHFFPTRVTLFGKGVVNLKSALSLDFNNFRFKEDFNLNPDADVITPVASTEPLSKNKLTTTFVQIPLLLNFKTRPQRESSVEFSVGGYAGYMLDAKTKRIDMDNNKFKDHDDYNLNPVKYGLTARLDFKWFDFYVNYNLSNFFADGQGPKTQIVEAGVNLLNY